MKLRSDLGNLNLKSTIKKGGKRWLGN
jgi:hypothetical protein